MALRKEDINALLCEAEGTALDFKMEQYRWSNATEDEKGEILKDILAFANASRDRDALILLGVRQREGQLAEVVGITDHPDDASLQQFVNSKTNQTLIFSYEVVQYDGLQLGCIRVPVQARPFYLVKSYGRLRPRVVFVRRGSSTAEADPDDLVKMGLEDYRAQQERLPLFVRQLPPKAQRVAVERPRLWEYELFSSVLDEEVARHADKCRDVQAGTTYGQRLNVDGISALMQVLGAYLDEGSALFENLTRVTEATLPVAFGPPGQPGNAELIVYAARRFGDSYGRALEWTLEVRRLHCSDENAARVVEAVSQMLLEPCHELRAFSLHLANLLRDWKENGVPTGQTVDITLRFRIPDDVTREVNRQLARLRAAL